MRKLYQKKSLTQPNKDLGLKIFQKSLEENIFLVDSQKRSFYKKK